jgi:hypothetical protein
MKNTTTLVIRTMGYKKSKMIILHDPFLAKIHFILRETICSESGNFHFK